MNDEQEFAMRYIMKSTLVEVCEALKECCEEKNTDFEERKFEFSDVTFKISCKLKNGENNAK